MQKQATQVKDVEEESDPEEKGEMKEEEIVWEGNFKRLQLYNMAGLTSKKSFMLWGELQQQKVLILIDSRASHNFMSNE